MEMRKETEIKFSQLPASATNFIKLIVSKMRYRRKVQQDVQAELAAHFEDELKDCATDDEKEQKAQKLIEEFGNVKLLAVLLRRAKKRCRPLWRTVVARTFQTIGILILCFIVYTVWFISGKPTINVDYLALLNQMARPQLRDDDNAWPYYQKAINLYTEPVRGGVIEEFLSYRNAPSKLKNVLRFTDLSIDEQEQILKWIKDNQKYWDNLTAEQKSVVLKCFHFNTVPVFKGTLAPLYTTFESMTRHIIEDIKQNGPVTEPGYNIVATVAPEVTGFPDAELTEWVGEDKVPPNFFEAVSVAVLNEWMKRYNDLPKSARAALTDTECEYLRPWINSNEAAWQEFMAGSSKSYCYKEYSYEPNQEHRSLFDVVLPHLSTLKGLARFGILHCRVSLREGKTHEGLEDCLAIARASRHWQGKGTIVEQLVGIAIGALAHHELLDIVATQNLSAADLKQLQQRLSQIYSEGYPLMNMEGERLLFLDIVQRVFTDGGPGGGHLVPDRWSRWMDNENDFEMWRKLGLFTPLSTAASMVHVGRNETLAKANEFYDRCAEIAKTTPYERHVRKIERSDIMLVALPRYRYFLIHYFAPALERASDVVYRSKASHEATVTILALKRYWLENKEYPASLNELIAKDYLKELPMDPFSDKELIYKRTNGDFILYSLGYNFIDDGGQFGKDSRGEPRRLWADNGDSVFWPLTEAEE
ncbi:MAG: hypothetical protein MUP16_02900 [Sedimentisphaerales bacterium]|nr:hypothetical protein [Sedimentisphaerales bacterium]